MPEHPTIDLMKKSLFVLFLFASMIGCYYDVEQDLYSNKPCNNSVISYNGRIKNIMEASCTSCHSGSTPSDGIALTNFTEVKNSDQLGKWLCSIEQGASCSSMPKGGKLSDCDIEACQLWVAQGYPEN
jgi:hypothetical protein